MGRYTRFFIACSIGFIMLTFINPTVSDDAPLEINGKAHSEHAASHRDFHHHHKHHHHHHQHHHQHHNHDIDVEETKKNHHRRNRKMSLNPPMRGNDNEALQQGDLQSSFVSFQAFLDRNSARPARNRREKDVTSPPIKSMIVSASVALNTTITTAATTTTTSTPATATDVTDSLFDSVATKESSSKPSIACSNTNECTNITNSICTDQKCECTKELPVFIASTPECINPAVLNATCKYNDQCLFAEEYSSCDTVTKRCVCIAGYEMKEYPDVGVNCVTKTGKSSGLTVDPAMIGVLAGLGLMFVIICVVLRLFSKARFRENRSIFNTPNPRLMNASLFKDSKLLSPARGERRGSRASMRGPPSRAPSITSVNKDGAGRSPNGSLSKGRRGSTLSTASATGSAGAAAPTSVKTPSPTSEKKQQQKPAETTVAIEAVD